MDLEQLERIKIYKRKSKIESKQAKHSKQINTKSLQ